VDEELARRDQALSESANALARHAAELEHRRVRIEELEQAMAWLADRVVASERAAVEMRRELEQERGRGEDVELALTALAGELDGLRSAARGQATRIRLRALRDAAELADRVAEVSRRPADTRDRLIEALHESIKRIARAEDEPEPMLAELVAAESSNGHGEVDPEEMFNGMVEVEVGPLSDFSQLVGFEDAAGGISATSEISVTRFAAGRATLEMRLDQPVELLRELEERSPFEFTVRGRRFDRLVLEVEDAEQLSG
jgi:DNA repair exonuclease SbcCD ATPase subunit